MKAKILSLGAIYHETNSTPFPLPDNIQLDTELVGSKYEITVGGSAVIFSKVIARLDTEPVFIGKIGTDLSGRMLEQMLVDEGITPSLIKDVNVDTNIAQNFIRQDGKSLMFVSGNANQSLSIEEACEKIFENLPISKYLYLGGGFKLKKLLNSYEKIIEKAKKHSVKIILDHGRVTNSTTEEDKQNIRKIIPLVDYYFPSRDELLDVWEEEQIENAMLKVKSRTGAILAVKDSSNGAYALQGEDIIKCPARKVIPINTVGAGDSFNAGFISAQLHEMDLENSLKFAVAVSALKISRARIPTFDEVKSYMEEI